MSGSASLRFRRVWALKREHCSGTSRSRAAPGKAKCLDMARCSPSATCPSVSRSCLPPSPKVSTPAAASRDLWEQLEASGDRPTPVRLDDTGLLLRCSICGLATHSKKVAVWLRSPCMPSAALNETGKLTGIFSEPSEVPTTRPPEVGQPAVFLNFRAIGAESWPSFGESRGIWGVHGCCCVFFSLQESGWRCSRSTCCIDADGERNIAGTVAINLSIKMSSHIDARVASIAMIIAMHCGEGTASRVGVSIASHLANCADDRRAPRALET